MISSFLVKLWLLKTIVCSCVRDSFVWFVWFVVEIRIRVFSGRVRSCTAVRSEGA